MDKPASKRNELYVLITIIIAICSCCGTWMAVPQLHSLLENVAGESAPQIPISAGEETLAGSGETYNVTIINDVNGHLRFDGAYTVAPEQLITFKVGIGLHKIPIEYSYDGETAWRLNTSLELDLNHDVTFNCKDRSTMEQTVKSIGVIFGFIEFDKAYGVNCRPR